VIDTVARIGKRSFEKVATHCRREIEISVNPAKSLIVRIGIINVPETTLYVATNIIIEIVTKVAVVPDGKISLVQLERRTVEYLITVEGHVIDLIIRFERECLCTYFYTDGYTLCFGVDVAVIVKHPEKCVITEQF